MKNLEQKYTEEYINIINKFDDDVKGKKLAWQVMSYSPCKYHGQPTHFSYLPRIFSYKTKQNFAHLAQTSYSIINKCISYYFCNEDFRNEFNFDNRIKQLILLPNTINYTFPYGRVDFIYNENTHSACAVEFNAEASSGMLENKTSLISISQTKSFKNFYNKYSISDDIDKTFYGWVDKFINIFEQNKFYYYGAHIAIVVLLESKNPDIAELREYKKIFENRGFKCSVIDARQLKYDGVKLYAQSVLDGYSNTTINCIWRWTIISDLLRYWKNVQDYINAIKDEKVAQVGGFQSQIAHDKQLFSILHKRHIKKLFNKEEQKFIETHIPYTINLEDTNINMDKIINEKNNWIIKPTDLYATQNVVCGEDLSKEKWINTIENCKNISIQKNIHFVLQKFTPPYKTPTIPLSGKENCYYESPKMYGNIIGIYLHFGQFSGVYVRQGPYNVIGSAKCGIVSPVIWIN